MSTEKELSWLSGFIDGEGCLGLFLFNYAGNDSNGIHHQFIVVNTHEASIKECKRIISDIVGREVRYSVRDYKDKPWRALYRICLSKESELIVLCRTLLPYLVTKVEQAKLMLEYLAIAPGKGGRLTDDHSALVYRMRALNTKKGLLRNVLASARD